MRQEYNKVAMMITYENIIIFSWAAFLAVWLVLAFNVKRDVRGGFTRAFSEYWWLRILIAIIITIAAINFGKGTAHYGGGEPYVFRDFFIQIPWLGWLGAAITVAGLAIAVWARVHLGRNWSPAPSVKEHHELVTSGPYAFVRHPIYTGVIAMALGTALTGSLFGIGVFIFGGIIFILRISKEEKIMLELFPGQYPAYQKRTKALVPFVW